MLPCGVRVEGRAVLEVDLFGAARLQPAQRRERLRHRIGRPAMVRDFSATTTASASRRRRRAGLGHADGLHAAHAAAHQVLARSVAPVKSSAMRRARSATLIASCSGSVMPGKILITAASSSRPKPAVDACMNIWCAVAASGSGNLRRACGVEHQPEVLDEDVHRRQRRVVAGQHVRHAVLEHPAVAGAVRDHLVQRGGVDAFAQAERHRLGGGGDVHAGEQLVDDLHLAAVAGAVAEPVDLARPSRRGRAGLGIGLGLAARSSSSSGPTPPWPRRRRSAHRGRAGPALRAAARSRSTTLGSTVEHITNTLPGLHRRGARRASPNSTCSVCAALTTTRTTTSQRAASSAGVAQAMPPSAAKACATASGRTSQHVHRVAGAAQRAGHAAPHGAEADQADLAPGQRGIVCHRAHRLCECRAAVRSGRDARPGSPRRCRSGRRRRRSRPACRRRRRARGRAARPPSPGGRS